MTPSTEKKGSLNKDLEELWKKAKGRVYQPGYLVKTFRLRRYFELRSIQLHEVKVEILKSQVPDCDNCVDICCTGPNAVVSLRLSDIARLVDAGLSQHIVRPRPDATDEGKVQGKRLPVFSRASHDLKESLYSRVFPVLSRDKTGTCTLLDENRLCGAYPGWPLSCARYPFALDADNKRMFWAAGCGEKTLLPATETAGRVRDLVEACLRSYNERIKDVVLLHVALPELFDMGFFEFLNFEGYLAREAGKIQAAHRNPNARGAPIG
jgi:Fe-S-cluster containining protein